MAADFPDNPNVNDTFTVGDRSWIWNGTTWDAAVEEVLSADAPITFNSSTRTVGLDQAGVQDGRNYIINGAFDIFQRGRGPFTNPGFFTDRFLQNGPGETFVVETKKLTPGDIEAIGFGDIKNYLEVDLQVNNGSARFETRLEDARTLSGQEVTLSFWARSDVNGLRFLCNLRQEFIDSARASVFGEVSLSTTWERYEIQYTLPSVTGKTINDASYLLVEFRFDGTDTARLDITGVQLEAGSVATPFKRHAPSLQGELAACQRYYYQVVTGTGGSRAITNGYMYSSSQLEAVLTFPTTMRAVPSLISGSGTGAFKFDRNGAEDLLDDFFAAQGTTQSILIANNTDVSGTAGQAGRIRSATTDGSLALDAEL